MNPVRLWQLEVHVSKGQQDTKSDDIACHYGRAKNQKTERFLS